MARRHFALIAIILPAALVAAIAMAAQNGAQNQLSPHLHQPKSVDLNPITKRIAIDTQRPRRLVLDGRGNLYIADSGAGTVVKRTPNGSSQLIAKNLNDPSGLVLGKNGAVIVTEHADGRAQAGAVWRIAANGARTLLAKNLTGPKGMAFDRDGNLFVALFEANAIVRIDPKGGVSTFARNIPTPAALAVDRAGNVYAANSIPGTVSKISPQGDVSVIAKDLRIPSDLAVHPHGFLVVTNYAGAELTKLNQGKTSRFDNVPEGTISIAFDPIGNMVFASWDDSVVYHRTSVLLIPCPHCDKKIPLYLKPKRRTKSVEL